jgi:hypothetical protein
MPSHEIEYYIDESRTGTRLVDPTTNPNRTWDYWETADGHAELEAYYDALEAESAARFEAELARAQAEEEAEALAAAQAMQDGAAALEEQAPVDEPATEPAGAAPPPPCLPVYIPVPDEPPPPKRPLKRAAPSIARVDPFPVLPNEAESEWRPRLHQLTTATDPNYLMKVGCNALVELRCMLAGPIPEEQRGPLGQPATLRPLWGRIPEAELDVRALELVLERELNWLAWTLEVVSWAGQRAFEEVSVLVWREAANAQIARVEEVIQRLRKRLRKRGTVRKLAAVLTRLAAQAKLAA